MIGTIIGDVIGSRFEHRNYKGKDFSLFDAACRPTDDTVMSLAVATAIMESAPDFSDLGEQTIRQMQKWGRMYPYAGYGGAFRRWLRDENPQPYNSWGNGSAMRVSACGYAGQNVEQVKALARTVTEVTHNHPEGIKGAEAVAVAVFMARSGYSKQEIRDHVTANYYTLDFSLDSIRDSYYFDVSCQGSVPQALQAFFESCDFVDAIRSAISIGGDSDTIAAITGSVAAPYYGVPAELREQTLQYLDSTMLKHLQDFEARYPEAHAEPQPMKQAPDSSLPPRYTPGMITELRDKEIFVFGSNLAGMHAGGAARFAYTKFGAIWGQGEGLQGQSYAIPTMQGGVETIAPYVDTFIAFAQAHPELHFLVTPVGCGIAGFSEQEIAPLFRAALNQTNISLPESFYRILIATTILPSQG